MVWRTLFPTAIQQALVTSDHRDGTISISDLELAGTIAHKDNVLVHTVPDVVERPLWLAGDNRASLLWATKGSATVSTARAYLLWLNALHQHHHRYVAQHDYFAGKANVIANDARRRWDLSDADLISHFNAHYPQATSWTLLTLLAATHSALIGALSHQRCIPVSLRIAPSNRPVRSRTVKDAVRHGAQTFLRVGSPDPRLNAFGELDFRLQALFRLWKKSEDRPPTRVKPLPLVVLCGAHFDAMAPSLDLCILSAGDCLLLAYFFLLRPGEYSGLPVTAADDLFRIQDVGIWIGHRCLDPLHSPPDDLLATTFVTLTFTLQKNGVRGETLGHGQSGHPTLCPVAVISRRLLHLCAAGATPRTPINAPSPVVFRLSRRHHRSPAPHRVAPPPVTHRLLRERHLCTFHPCGRRNGHALWRHRLGPHPSHPTVALQRDVQLPACPSAAHNVRGCRHHASRFQLSPKFPSRPSPPPLVAHSFPLLCVHWPRKRPNPRRSASEVSEAGSIVRALPLPSTFYIYIYYISIVKVA